MRDGAGEWHPARGPRACTRLGEEVSEIAKNFRERSCLLELQFDLASPRRHARAPAVRREIPGSVRKEECVTEQDCEYAAGSTKGCGDEMLTFAASKKTAFTTVHGTTHVCNTPRSGVAEVR